MENNIREFRTGKLRIRTGGIQIRIGFGAPVRRDPELLRRLQANREFLEQLSRKEEKSERSQNLSN